MPGPQLTATLDILSAVLDRDEAAYRAATSDSAWALWEGHAYCGGGADLNIGAGDRWLSNMESRHGADFEARIEHDAMEPECGLPLPDCQICSMNAEITGEQRANAVNIVRNACPVRGLRRIAAFRSLIAMVRAGGRYGDLPEVARILHEAHDDV